MLFSPYGSVDVGSQPSLAKVCHPERSEGSGAPDIEILRCAQDDMFDFGRVNSSKNHQVDSPAYQPSSRGDVRIGQRPVLEFPRVFALESQRLRVVALEESDKERERQEIVCSQLEQLDVVMHRQRLALFV